MLATARPTSTGFVWYFPAVIRRCGLVVVLAGLAVGFGLPPFRAALGADLAGPRAVRLVTPAGERVRGNWQAWANASRMPTVTGPVTLRLTGCPGLPDAAGCVYTHEPRVVYLRRNLREPRAVLLHELGHVFDLTVMGDRDRASFRRIMRRPGASWWRGKRALAEWFAEAYSWCARHSKIVSIKAYALYSYNPTPAQHRSVCQLIRRAARDRTPPSPPPAPPPVIDDPTPRVASPAAPSIVPGVTARDAEPPRRVTVSATATPRPVVTPVPTVPSPTPTPAPTSTPSPEPEPEPAPAPAPSEPEPSPSPEPTAEPTETATPEPEPTEDPTPSPTPGRG